LELRKFRVIKPEIRVLGVDDGVFVPHTGGFAQIVGVVFRGGLWLDGVISTRVKVDGFDATDKIASMAVNSPHYQQLRIIMLDGVTFAGFNVVDIKKLSAKTGLPVIAVTRNKPNLEKVREALRNLPKSELRWSAIVNAGKILEVPIRSKANRAYMEISGISEEDARKIVQLTSTRSTIPEALRVAHLIASGITTLA
jgi:endonuclease V-like protein UPF0215 family